MSSNNPKKTNTKAGIITIAVIVLMFILDLILFSESEKGIGYYLPIVPVLLCGILLLFVSFKGVGWAIAASVFLGTLVDSFTNEFDLATFITRLAALIVCLGLLLHKNLKKQ